MTAAGKLPAEKRGVFLERVVARLGLLPRSTAAEFADAVRVDPGQINGLMPPRRFPPPWTAEVTRTVSSCAIQLVRRSYVYYENGPGRRSAAPLKLRRGNRAFLFRRLREAP
jgi:hypothetical protein